jgi:hypothetical protein
MTDEQFAQLLEEIAAIREAFSQISEDIGEIRLIVEAVKGENSRSESYIRIVDRR